MMGGSSIPNSLHDVSPYSLIRKVDATYHTPRRTCKSESDRGQGAGGQGTGARAALVALRPQHFRPKRRSSDASNRHSTSAGTPHGGRLLYRSNVIRVVWHK